MTPGGTRPGLNAEDDRQVHSASTGREGVEREFNLDGKVRDNALQMKSEKSVSLPDCVSSSVIM
jgi:hypothetical protein